MPRLTIQTPTGDVTLTEDDGAIIRVDWGGNGRDHSALLDRAAQQMAAYFAEPARGFDLPLRIMCSILPLI